MSDEFDNPQQRMTPDKEPKKVSDTHRNEEVDDLDEIEDEQAEEEGFDDEDEELDEDLEEEFDEDDDGE